MIAYWSLTLLFWIFEWKKFWLSFFCVFFFWRMLLEYSSTFEPCILALRKRKLKKRKTQLPGRERLTKQWHYLEYQFSKQWQRCRYRSRTVTNIYNSPFYGSSHSYQLLLTFAKKLHPRCLQVSRIPSWYIYPNILISYLIYLQKIKNMVPFIHFS